MLVHYSNTRSQSKYKIHWSSLLSTRRLTSYSHEKPTHIRIPLYSNTSGSRVLKPSSEIRNFIVRKIYHLYKKELYKNSFKKVNIHVSSHSVNLPKSTAIKDLNGYLRLPDIRPFQKSTIIILKLLINPLAVMNILTL